MKKNTTKTTTIETIFEGFRKNIKTVKKDWSDVSNKNVLNVTMELNNYNGKINLRRLLYWTVCGKVDTALRPIMMNIIDLLAMSNGYALFNENENTVNFQKMFMTGIKKSQIKNACKVFAQGIAIGDDAKQFEEVLTNFYCGLSITGRIHAFEDMISDYGSLVM